ncbi:hypothetical protein [Burkholderia pseudomallei]|uniref:hypothetical protein n=1 Tax=Burkholderia pseudomallei TaxID=28450 RepID=UPI001E403F89|nr:hypothetical protein [Burkholderia pseudomallei]
MRVPLMRMGPNAGRLNRRDPARSAIVYRLPPGSVCRQAARAARHLRFGRRVRSRRGIIERQLAPIG